MFEARESVSSLAELVSSVHSNFFGKFFSHIQVNYLHKRCPCIYVVQASTVYRLRNSTNRTPNKHHHCGIYTITKLAYTSKYLYALAIGHFGIGMVRPQSMCYHTCQLSTINCESPYFGRHSHSPSLFCQKWPDLPILRASPYFLLDF